MVFMYGQAGGNGREAARMYRATYPKGSTTHVTQHLEPAPLDPKFAGSNPAGVDGFFSERKNPEYDFLRKGTKAVGPMS